MTLLDAGVAIDALVAEVGEQLDRWHVPGLQLAVVRHGDVLFAGGLGVRGVDDPAPVTASTLFDHGSCGKAFTGLLAALLAEEGALDLDAPVRRYVPELRLTDAFVADRVTMRDLLSHRSGLARHDLAWILNPSLSREELVRRLEHLPLRGDLRAQWEYSNFGFALAGLAIGRATGSTWEDQIRLRVLEPLGMTRTTTSVERALADPDHATPHVLRTDDRSAATPWRVLNGTAPAGGLLTCAHDAVRWLLLHTGEDLLSSTAAALTRQAQMVLPPDTMPHAELESLGYGLGWVVGRFRGRRMAWHSGGVDGFLTQTLLLPDQRIGVTTSANQHLSGLPLAAVLHIVDRLLGERGEPSWFDRLDPYYAAVSGDGDGAAASTPAQRAAEVGEPTRGPVHILSRYAGTYRDPGYGDITVAVRRDELSVRVGEMPMTATHRNLDTWDLRYDVLDVDFPLTFLTDADGQVAEALVALEDATGPTRFRRVAQDRA